MDGSKNVKGCGAPGDLVRLCGLCDACFTVAMNRKEGGIMYTCLVNGAPQLGGNRKSKRFQKKGIDVRYDMAVHYPDG